MNACAGGADRKLVEARFLRALDEGERKRLERHLLGCASCSEKYRRLQLAERVASVGTDRALEEPSFLEIERIAGDLGLFGPPKTARNWLPFAGLLAAVACALLLIVLRPQDPSETFTPRGDPSGLTFAAYVIAADGAIRSHTAVAPVSKDDHLKLRVSRPDKGKPWPKMFLVIATDTPKVIELVAPEKNEPAASIPGAIPLAGLPSGKVTAYVIATDEADEQTLSEAVRDRPAADRVRQSLGRAVVERIELEVR